MLGLYWLRNRPDWKERDSEGIDGEGEGPHCQVRVGEAAAGHSGRWHPGHGGKLLLQLGEVATSSSTSSRWPPFLRDSRRNCAPPVSGQWREPPSHRPTHPRKPLGHLVELHGLAGHHSQAAAGADALVNGGVVVQEGGHWSGYWSGDGHGWDTTCVGFLYFEKWDVFNQCADNPVSYWKVEEVSRKWSYLDFSHMPDLAERKKSLRNGPICKNIVDEMRPYN
jgi:hypothetical protein